MTQQIVLTVNIFDDEGNRLSSKDIFKKEILPPTNISNFGYNQDEQLEVIKRAQQAMLDVQVNFLKSETRQLS